MKVPIKKILFYSGMVLLGLVVVFLVCRVLLNLDALGNTVRGIFGSLRAIVLGCVMAYLLYPLTRFSEQFLLYHKVRKKTARSLSTAFSTFVLLALIVLFAYFIIPQLVFNVPPLIQNLPNMVSDFSATNFRLPHRPWTADHHLTLSLKKSPLPSTHGFRTTLCPPWWTWQDGWPPRPRVF